LSFRDRDDKLGGGLIMSMGGRDLYLDLLIKVLTNMIYGDPSNNPANTGPFQSELRAIGYDWPVLAHTMVGLQRLQNVRELAQRALDENIPGDFIEAGIWRGGCCILMRGVLKANGVKDRKVYAADSFAGLPPPNPETYPADRDFDLSVYKELAVSLDAVKDNFDRYGLLDDQVVFVEGLFAESLHGIGRWPVLLDSPRRRLLRIDFYRIGLAISKTVSGRVCHY
jgi:O-methyltransferase